jgi:hypothetical protein
MKVLGARLQAPSSSKKYASSHETFTAYNSILDKFEPRSALPDEL